MTKFILSFFVGRKPPDSLGVQYSFSDELKSKTPSIIIFVATAKKQQYNRRRTFMKNIQINDIKSLAHTTWNCKYHIVFAPKYRRKVFYKSKRLEIGQILRQLCEWKGVTIIEAEVCPDHIHMLVEIPPKYSVSSFMGFLKGKSSLMIYSKWANMRYQYRNREFWCRGYYVDTVGKNTKKIKEYIANQLKEDQLSQQMTIEDFDPFKG